MARRTYESGLSSSIAHSSQLPSLKPLIEYFGDQPLLKIRAEDIRAYQKSRFDASLSGKTINMEVGVVRFMLKRAKTWHLVADDVRLYPKSPKVIGKY